MGHCWARAPSAWAEVGRRESGREKVRGEDAHNPLPTLSRDRPCGSFQPENFKVLGWRGRGPPGQDPCPLGHSLLRPHVCLRDANFVHELAKSNRVVAGELPQDLG